MTSLEITGLTSTTIFRARVETNLCLSTTEVFEVKIKELPEPVIFFEKGLLNTIDGDYTYLWYKNDILIATTVVNRVRIQGAGNYRVVIENENGCQAASTLYRFPQQLRTSDIRVFPNPSSYLVSVIMKNIEGFARVELRTSSGMLVKSQMVYDGYGEFDVSDIAKGTYLIVITDKYGQSLVERLVVN